MAVCDAVSRVPPRTLLARIRESASVDVRRELAELRVPIVITVDDPLGLYAATIRDQLKGGAGFQWQDLQQAAQFCLDIPVQRT